MQKKTKQQQQQTKRLELFGVYSSCFLFPERMTKGYDTQIDEKTVCWVLLESFCCRIVWKENEDSVLVLVPAFNDERMLSCVSVRTGRKREKLQHGLCLQRQRVHARRAIWFHCDTDVETTNVRTISNMSLYDWSIFTQA